MVEKDIIETKISEGIEKAEEKLTNTKKRLKKKSSTARKN